MRDIVQPSVQRPADDEMIQFILLSRGHLVMRRYGPAFCPKQLATRGYCPTLRPEASCDKMIWPILLPWTAGGERYGPTFCPVTGDEMKWPCLLSRGRLVMRGYGPDFCPEAQLVMRGYGQALCSEASGWWEDLVCSYTNSPKNKRTLIAPSCGLFLTCKAEK